MNQSSELKQRLQEHRERLLAAITGVTEEQFKRRPAVAEGEPAAWCIGEVLAHLLHSSRIWCSRIGLALASDGATVTLTNPEEGAAAARAGRIAPIPQLTHGLLAAQREIDGLIERVEAMPAGWQQGVEHPRSGRLTVQRMFETELSDHLLEHIIQIEAIKAEVAGDTTALSF